MRHAISLTSVVLIGLLAPAAPGQDKQLAIQKKFTGKVANVNKPMLKTAFIATGKDWKRVWKHIKPTAKLPEVDFAKNILLVQTKNAGDPNRRRVSVLRDNQGIIKIRAISTLIGFQPKDETIYTFYQVSRAGVTGVSRYNRALRKFVVDPLPKGQ